MRFPLVLEGAKSIFNEAILNIFQVKKLLPARIVKKITKRNMLIGEMDSVAGECLVVVLYFGVAQV